jgi:hypothetical protein
MWVANRVAACTELYRPQQWKWLPGKENTSADMASRGKYASELINEPTWLNGPNFLMEDEETWPILTIPVKLEPTTFAEKKAEVPLSFVVITIDKDLIDDLFNNIRHSRSINGYCVGSGGSSVTAGDPRTNASYHRSQSLKRSTRHSKSG